MRQRVTGTKRASRRETWLLSAAILVGFTQWVGNGGGGNGWIGVARAEDDAAVVARMEKELLRLQSAQEHIHEEQKAIDRDMSVIRGEISRRIGHRIPASARAPDSQPEAQVARENASSPSSGNELPHGNGRTRRATAKTPHTELASTAPLMPTVGATVPAAMTPTAAVPTPAVPTNVTPSQPVGLADEIRPAANGGVIDTGPAAQMAVVAHRVEDTIARLASNNVGPHPRETAGAQATGALGDHGVFSVGPVTFILGGFIDSASVYENRHVASGTFNYWQDMPFRNDPRYHTKNFEGSARYSRLSFMARGNIDPETTISGMFESDFGAGAATTDAYESNSYAFRLRQAYAAFDDNRDHWHFLAGQAWSMLTPGRTGIVPRQESLPETIEASMLAGQTWARQWQVRAVKDFLNHRLWAGLSVENPQTLYDTTGFTSSGGRVTLPNGGVATVGENGTGLTNNALFSNEIAPDVIAKLAYDPRWGHYEVEGIVHFPHDRVTVNHVGHNNTAIGGGGGGSVILPVLPHYLEVRLAGLAGWGVNRYGSVLLPDATLNAKGAPAPLFGVQATAGIIAHPTPRIDVYGYFGTQRVGKSSFNMNGGSYGYGNPLYSNAGCMQELSSLTCTANTRGVSEVSVGAWWRFFKGKFGTVEGGAQLAYSHRDTWSGQGEDPHTDMSQIFFDFRYLPFQ